MFRPLAPGTHKFRPCALHPHFRQTTVNLTRKKGKIIISSKIKIINKKQKKTLFYPYSFSPFFSLSRLFSFFSSSSSRLLSFSLLLLLRVFFLSLFCFFLLLLAFHYCCPLRDLPPSQINNNKKMAPAA